MKPLPSLRPSRSLGLQAFLLGVFVAFAAFLPYIIYDKGLFLYYGDFNVQQIPFYQLANEAVRTGEFTRESRVYGWESTAACLDATSKGYRTVVMPGQYFYFDMRQSPHEAGHDWAAIFDALDV